MATILAKSKAYEKNVLGLINRYPQLGRIVREREALERRYEALLARDARRAKQPQPKRADDIRHDRLRAVSNELNTDDQYDIRCSRGVPTGTLLRQRECHPVFVNRATEDATQAFLGGYAVEPANSKILRKWPDFQKTLEKAIQTHPELQTLARAHAEAQKRYEVVRKLKFKGRIFVLD